MFLQKHMHVVSDCSHESKAALVLCYDSNPVNLPAESLAT